MHEANRDMLSRTAAQEESATINKLDSEPIPPVEDRPKYQRPDDGLAHLTTTVAIIVSVIIGIGMFTGGFGTQAFNLMLNGLLIGLGIPVMMLLSGLIIRKLSRGIYDWRYGRKFAKSGWKEYEEDLRVWKLLHDQPPAGAGSNSQLSPIEVNDSRPFAIQLPAPRHFRRKAKELAKRRTKRLAAGKDFITEVTWPARRMHIQKEGDVDNKRVSLNEVAAVRAIVAPYFVPEKLTVVKIGLRWVGKHKGVSGSYDNLEVVVRLR